MSRIIPFYENALTIHPVGQRGQQFNFKRVVEVWCNDAWERQHDFIQWLFPLPEASAYNPNAPLLTEQDRNQLAHVQRFKDRLERAYYRFTEFLGLEVDMAKA
jgi:hypothetical protein